ncbi:efflux RND transporter periplasmic adaptor subunit [Marinobacterium arenosum]|uniref:efflux RND transporter periplasmic adaptor subunit n=1 Tax=Marinobacterium arenosum TaxID=2862496 RepID=UPI001C958C4E|nr:HlyD family efflux transporter periplasmic adaptor subunit [Marinobacterium arenosum]MBY4678021.1 HlyD family efflux transporter periplasmic adaptor subunit [Marinobacterium arenosum]
MTSERTRTGSKLLRWIVPILLLLAGVAVYSALKASKPSAPARPAQEKVWTVHAINAELTSHRPELTLYGKVESPRRTTLSAAVTAFVSKVQTDEGRVVSAGDPLIQLDPRDAELLVQEREAEQKAIEAQIKAEQVRHQANLKALQIERELLALSERTVQRYQNLASRKVGSEDQLDSARRTYQQQALSLNTLQQELQDHPNRLAQLEANRQRAEAQLASARLDLERTLVSAPFTARIAKLSVAPGDRVTSGSTLLILYALDNIEVRAQIPSRHLAIVRQALAEQGSMSAEARLDGQSIQLQLDRLAGEVDGGRAGIDALFRVGGQQPLEPGRALQLSLTLPAQPGSAALPPQALYGLDRIYRISDGRLEALQVERLGDISGSDGRPYVLVRADNLRDGDRIITTQLPNAISGLKVNEAGAR